MTTRHCALPVSILYLRCWYGDIYDELREIIGFNSLFEMRICARCNSSLRLRSFNSLFEMPPEAGRYTTEATSRFNSLFEMRVAKGDITLEARNNAAFQFSI